jgi:outer membrane biogenesis lipoprotein LolB
MTRLALLLAMLLLTACAMGPQPYLDTSKPSDARQRDLVECQAIAAQSAQGQGAWFSDPAMRAATFANARDTYLAQCLQSRGWSWQRP